MHPRREKLLALADFSGGPGLEIGPLHKALTLKSETDVYYVDVMDAEQLREHYADDDTVPKADIVDPDFTLLQPDGTIRSLVGAAAAKAPYKWIIASHVIEHVPDVIGWLGELAELCEDDATVLLLVPDKRYTFDFHRPLTTVGQMLHAHHLGDRTPSVRAVYDFFRSAVIIPAPDAWAGRSPDPDNRIFTEDQTLDAVERAKTGEYVDAHVWMWYPSTFVEQIIELGALGLCDFVIETINTTPVNALEFQVVLRRLPRERTPEEDAELRTNAVSTVEHVAMPAAGPAKPAMPHGAMKLSTKEQKLIRRKRALLLWARKLIGRAH